METEKTLKNIYTEIKELQGRHKYLTQKNFEAKTNQSAVSFTIKLLKFIYESLLFHSAVR